MLCTVHWIPVSKCGFSDRIPGTPVKYHTTHRHLPELDRGCVGLIGLKLGVVCTRPWAALLIVGLLVLWSNSDRWAVGVKRLVHLLRGIVARAGVALSRILQWTE